ncbi:MacB family efflux pump subunit [candidate division WOR-1 bacterium RIFOXYB2_FULL_42_35]|uniref:MacB family efflux pump subunit n=1 Tax=candidate division WOR-1 bacterium RIFOXYC2_FULL_41_25 TaxID=1802586 RepID=A0A1F4TPU3_UNCSA|nr:MAG: MacB family efflux pump subunit [candidate division WOR-1 bacterium RIFOXYA2_FULL_41_14]OGC25186.1 MAG: MacB family efflux pump subunit [candidate division WOR-1 bacterium RIFOXYB2_FULL_42_35]OGC34742.1 MAG: MacB family efflux pump subunit [candidate division WOR-1 bacterium RIFOXYC2_FULL_41_25]
MSLIELNSIVKTYYIGGNLPVHALQGVSLKIEAGEFVAIMGASGSGKSTLLAILGLLDNADNGEYKLLGKDITGLTENEYARLRNRFFGFIFQMFNLLPKLNVTDNTMLPFIYAGEASKENRQRSVEVLKKIGLEDRLHHRPNELSGGQQQRVAIARALANKPLVILADEPTGNLDSKSSQEIIDLLKELNAQGNTIIMVTHEHDVAAHASRIITLRDGSILSDDRKQPGIKTSVPVFNWGDKKGKSVFSFGRLKDYCYEATLSLLNNKLRSFLSILGVMIGVAAVITMLALGTGAQKAMEKTLSGLGTNLLMVRTSQRSHGISLGSDSVTRFTFADLAVIEQIESVEKVAPYVSGRGQAVYQNRNWNTSIVGSNYDFQYVRESVPDIGRFFTAAEAASRAKVAVLGKTVATELFGAENPVGKWIRINKVSFNVIGVMPEKGVSGWRNVDDQIVIPIKTAMYRLLGSDYISYFDVQVSDLNSMQYVQDEIIVQLVKLHRLPESQSDSIEVRNMAEIQKAAGEMISTLAYLLGAIAAVSLLVGGIGIMNIMLVMVMERTHEIGLRKALGAEKSDIMVQFLVESILICLFGGIVGIGFGSLISFSLATFAGWNVLISLGSIILAFTFSVLVGVVFGLWPAWRAAKLLPIVALRYE